MSETPLNTVAMEAHAQMLFVCQTVHGLEHELCQRLARFERQQHYKLLGYAQLHDYAVAELGLRVRKAKALLQTILSSAHVYKDGRIELEFRQ